MNSRSSQSDLKMETVSAKSSRPLWPWVVGAVCLSVAGLVYSFWWPMHRANRVLKNYSGRQGAVLVDYQADYDHPEWTRFFLEEDTFHPWFDELQVVGAYEAPMTDQLLDDLLQFHSLTELGMIIDNTPLEKLKQFESLEQLWLIGNVQPDDLIGTPFFEYYHGEPAALAQFESTDWAQLVEDLQASRLVFTYLNVHGSNVSNSNIESLEFQACELDETAGEALAGLKVLTHLWLYESVAEPAFWKKLSDHATLTSLTLEESPVSGEGWSALCRIEGLKELEIYFPWDKTKSDYAPDFELLKPPLQPEGSCPSDSEWEQLSGLTNLERLSLRNIQLSEPALRSIAALPHLKSLHVENISADPVAIALLGQSSSLKSIEVWDSSLTADELQEFSEAHPHLDVSHELRDSRAKLLIKAP